MPERQGNFLDTSWQRENAYRRVDAFLAKCRERGYGNELIGVDDTSLMQSDLELLLRLSAIEVADA